MKKDNVVESDQQLGSLERPIQCDGPAGERAYLDQLIAEPLQHIRYKRLGSISSAVGRLDQYRITNLHGLEIARLYFDMHHKDYVEMAVPKGFGRIDSQELERTVLESMFGDQSDIDRQQILCTLNEQYGTVQVDEQNHGYIHAKAQRLLLCGPRYYASEDFFSHPLNKWDWLGIVEASTQLVQGHAGLYREHPIVVNGKETLAQFWKTFHFEMQNLDVLDRLNGESSLLIEAQHSITKEKVQFWCRVRSQ